MKSAEKVGIKKDEETKTTKAVMAASLKKKTAKESTVKKSTAKETVKTKTASASKMK